MVDFWEVFGRLVTNDMFREEICTACQPVPYGLKPQKDLSNVGLNIPVGDFDAARKVVRRYMADAPVSLCTLGELRMTMSFQPFRPLLEQLVAAIKKSGAKTEGFSKLFYIAVGSMMLDKYIRAELAEGSFDEYQYGGLKHPERKAVQTIAADANVSASALAACELFWGTACIDTQTFWPDNIHPIVQQYPPVAPQP